MLAKNNRPLVSVVMPSYNHARFIRRSIESVLNQTYKNVELIIVDNNSEDNTDEVISTFSDERVMLLKTLNHGVIAASRNLGVRAAKGEWIAFLDSDDWWELSKLDRCMAKAAPDTVLIYHDMQVVDETERAIKGMSSKSRRLRTPVLEDLLIAGNIIANSSVVVKKSTLLSVGGLSEDEQMIACEDYNTWLKIATFSENFLYIPEYLGSYLYNLEGVSRKDMSLSRMAAIEPFLPSLSKDKLRKVQRQQKKILYTDGRAAYLNEDYITSCRKLSKCVVNSDLKITTKAMYMLIIAAGHLFLQQSRTFLKL